MQECDENFLKSCYIEYDTVAFNETVQVCRNPLVKDCNVEGPEICRTEHESECWTKQEVHNVQDDVVELALPEAWQEVGIVETVVRLPCGHALQEVIGDVIYFPAVFLCDLAEPSGCINLQIESLLARPLANET